MIHCNSKNNISVLNERKVKYNIMREMKNRDPKIVKAIYYILIILVIALLLIFPGRLLIKLILITILLILLIVSLVREILQSKRK